MKKKRILLVIVVGLVSAWAIYRSIVPSYSSVLEANWGIELPVKALCKEVYREDTAPSFHGDGIRYHVFSHNNASVIEEMLPWTDTDGNTLAWSQINDGEKTYRTYTEAAHIWLSELNISQEQYPDYDACFYWYQNKQDNSELIIFWNPEINRLYVIENII